MFRFAKDVAHHESQNKVTQYPKLAEFIKNQMENHTHHYVFSMTQIHTLQPEIESPIQAANILSAMLYPYGWFIRRDGVTLYVYSKD